MTHESAAPAGAPEITVHDGDIPESDAALVDDGIDRYNESRAPLHEVRPLGCMARVDGRIVGGAVGRTWGRLAELQQIWVDDALRGKGIGRELMQAFEATAAARGVEEVYLDTFSFQAPGFYESLGYRCALDLEGFSKGINRFTMRKRL